MHQFSATGFLYIFLPFTTCFSSCYRHSRKAHSNWNWYNKSIFSGPPAEDIGFSGSATYEQPAFPHVPPFLAFSKNYNWCHYRTDKIKGQNDNSCSYYFCITFFIYMFVVFGILSLYDLQPFWQGSNGDLTLEPELWMQTRA